MRRLVVLLALLLPALAAAPATAGGHSGIDWGPANWAAGVQMYTSDPSATDPYIHVRFKRVGGVGQRQVKMGEREKVEGSHRWGRYHFTRPEKLAVGRKVVWTTKSALPCEPAREPVGVVLQMRIKQPGKGWSAWTNWVSEDYFLLDCTDPS
jgi:hypothetical protein